MSRIDVYECETCKSRVDNYAQSPGWIQVNGTLARYAGVWKGGSYASAFVDGKHSGAYFCSLTCLEKKLDKLLPLPRKPEPCATCGATPPVDSKGEGAK